MRDTTWQEGKQPGAAGTHLEFRERPDARENRYPEGACGCGRTRTAARPEGARPGKVGYGPNLQAFAVYLMVVQHLPTHRVALLETLTGAKPSPGLVHGMLARVAGLLGEVDKRIRALITLAYAACCD